MKKRLDVLLVERGLATSREKAKAMIMAGEVLVDNEREDKAGSMFPEEVEIVLKGKPLPYVSRGGLKLEKAMKNFDLTLDGKVCMDVVASTGRFYRLYAAERRRQGIFRGCRPRQLDWKLRNDPRVVLHGAHEHPLRRDGGYRGETVLRIDRRIVYLPDQGAASGPKSDGRERRNCSSDQAAV